MSKEVEREFKPVFELGRTICTVAVHDKLGMPKTSELVIRHALCDFGDICEEDRKANVDAMENGYRILSAYETEHGRVFVITEADRSATTVLFADEY